MPEWHGITNFLQKCLQGAVTRIVRLWPICVVESWDSGGSLNVRREIL